MLFRWQFSDKGIGAASIWTGLLRKAIRSSRCTGIVTGTIIVRMIKTRNGDLNFCIPEGG